ncbi:HesA/MoeB/ThiF family protein [Roseobacter weihaiensis]|uniref:HesA/MoeB/ThiF family protein n=1 Tax=Roseobacter weihaiensis TaxID=2763262 RepID=UPI001D0A5BDB|nr:molybdopterin-synthase adenylyltransferase MoeB [Roseobacter sp. H9]
MVLVLGLCAVLWGVGSLMGAPRSARLTMIGLLYISVLALHVALPNGHPLRMATGESPALWLIIGGFVVLIVIYRSGLAKLRTRADASETRIRASEKQPLFNDTELNRYARHMVLRELGGPGQKKLKEARVLVIGAGGLGAPVLQYLAAAGVGTIGVIDDDTVENANLQRQVIHRDKSIGMPKVFSAQAEMVAQNPYVVVRPYHRRLTEDIAAELFADYDLVLDGTDNFETRYLVNAAAVTAGIPLISGALSQWEGQLSVFDPAAGAPCYRCVFDSPPAPELAPSCAEAGVVGPLPGVIGAMMAVEAIKLLSDAGTPLRGQMVIYDALYGESRTIAVTRRADCPTCGSIEAKAS